jgi:hypothetical protein
VQRTWTIPPLDNAPYAGLPAQPYEASGTLTYDTRLATRYLRAIRFELRARQSGTSARHGTELQVYQVYGLTGTCPSGAGSMSASQAALESTAQATGSGLIEAGALDSRRPDLGATAGVWMADDGAEPDGTVQAKTATASSQAADALLGGKPASPGTGPGNTMDGVAKAIARSEYRVTWQEHTALPGRMAAYQAPNRAHNLRTYFTAEGIQVRPRVSDSRSPILDLGLDSLSAPSDLKHETLQSKAISWTFGLRLAGYGYDGQVEPAGKGELATATNRIDYRYHNLQSALRDMKSVLQDPISALWNPISVNGTSTTSEGWSRALR